MRRWARRNLARWRNVARRRRASQRKVRLMPPIVSPRLRPLVSRSLAALLPPLVAAALGGCAGVRPEPTGAAITCALDRDECAAESFDATTGAFSCTTFES